MISTEPAGRVPKGGLARITSTKVSGSFSKLSSHAIGLRSVPMPCKYRFIEAKVTTNGVLSTPCNALLFKKSRLSLSCDCCFIQSYAANRNPPVPQAGSHTVSPILGLIQSTIAWIRGRGVKYCPAPLFLSCPFFSKIPS